MFKPTPKPKPNSSRTKPLSEAHIQASCTDFLELDGWRLFRTDLPHLRGLGVQEPGMADSLYTRYLYDPKNKSAAKCQCGMLEGCACSETMYIEWKRKGGKAGQHQKDWHAKERSRWAMTLIAGEDFPASIEGFCTWYQASGLRRKSISIPR